MPTRIFLAGASGAIGRPLTALLVAAGHEVTGMSRTAAGAAAIEAAGARAVIADAFDADALTAAVVACRPRVVIHQLTDLAVPSPADLTDTQLERNARLRVEGTRNLVEAAVAGGARRIVAQSIAWLYLPGPEPHTEEESVVPADAAAMTGTRAAVIELERRITTDPRFDGLVLRYGRLYGPGTWTATPPEPPTLHVEEAARAALLAAERGGPGIYHIVDDGGPVSNLKARSLLGWVP